MAAPVVSPRKSIREVVMQTVLAHHSQQLLTRKRKRLPSGASAQGVGDDDDIGFWEEEEGTMEMTQIGAERTKNVLILMSDTGGGHRASAEAIGDAFRIEFGDEYKVFVKDLFMEHAGWPLNDMERSYKFMVKHVQLWRVAFHGTSPRWIHNVYLAAIAAFYAKYGSFLYPPLSPSRMQQPRTLENIFHVHLRFIDQGCQFQELDFPCSFNLQKRVVFVTVITDLNTCHPTWFHTDVSRCYCPSEEVAKRASLDGLEPSQIRVFGLPIRPSFCRAVLVKAELRKELEMDPELPAVLLMGGGEGMGPVKKTAKALGESLFDKELCKPIGQLVVICGRNRTLSSALQDVQWKIPVKCYYVLLQEVGNVPYVVDNGAGVFSKSSKRTASLVARWFGPESQVLKQMSQNALKLAQPDAVFDIVKDIHQLTEQQGPLSQICDSLTSSSSLTSSFSQPV
ncbi:hypothetical protein BHM03_00051309 [Ensete ventricosum]|nr:hypothetical protein BHM03_00051309 [Ensete ventricosum]